MIYMDNAATSLQKPLQVEQAVLEALRTAGNPGRGAHEATLHASRLVYGARAAAAELFDAEDASRIAFTANATEALNIAISGLIRPGDHVITTVCEHNSVLRPLYRLRDQGATLSFVGVDARGNLKYVGSISAPRDACGGNYRRVQRDRKCDGSFLYFFVC